MLPPFATVLILIGLAAGILQSARRPLELVLAINEDSKCSVVSIRQTQHHRGLSDQPGHYVIERSKKRVAGLEEQLYVFAFDQEVFYELVSNDSTQVRSICNDIAWDGFMTFQSTVSAPSQQTVLFNNPVVDWKARVPPLHIERLIESGPSNNRVDFVFFADGCTYLLPVLFS
jgi:hypothetical protein